MKHLFPWLMPIVLFFSGILRAQDRPNILWITAEDMSATLGCYGDKYAFTPAIDHLAKQGVRYTNAFATNPVCSPCRSCLITGVYATSMGTQRLRSEFPLPTGVRGFPGLLRKAGYYTTNNVKTDYNTSDEKRLIEESWNENSPQAHWRGRSDPNQPFFAVFNDMTTHQSRTMVWPHAEFEEKIQSGLPEDRIHDPEKAPVPPYYPVVRRTLARFYDCVSAMDINTEKILAQLEEDGLADNTIVFFFSDHGSGLPRHKRLLYDSGMHVPLLVRLPKNYQHIAPVAPGETTDRLVSFVDFPATVLSLTGTRIPEYMQGRPFLGAQATIVEPRKAVFGARDRVDEAYDLARSVRTSEFLYIRNFMPHLSYNQPSVYSDQGAIRDDITRLAAAGKLNPNQMTYAWPVRAREELYAVEDDPDQLVNLAASKRHGQVLTEMRAQMKEWILKTKDRGFFPETESASFADTEIPVALEAAWKEPENPTMTTARYWKVIHLKRKAALSEDDQRFLETALEDPSPSVRIEAAGLMKNLYVLRAELRGDNPATVLRAMRQIQLLGDIAKKLEPDVREVYGQWQKRDDTSLALFIRFSAEAFLGMENRY